MGVQSSESIRDARIDTAALLQRNRELEATVAVLVDLLVDAGVIDRHVLDLRVEARVEELSETP